MNDIERLVSTLADDAGPTKVAPHPYVLSLKWLLAAVLYLVVLLLASGVRPDLSTVLTHPWFVGEIIALGLVLFAAVLSGALLSFPDLYQKRWLAYGSLWMFALFGILIVCAWQADSPSAPLPVHSFECTIDISLVALLPAASIFYAMRKFASTHFAWAGSVALIGAFSVGAIWLRLYEANDSILHVVEWHYLPMLVVGLIGLRLGKLLLRW